MHFSLSSLIVLAATASAASIPAPSHSLSYLGTWNVTLSRTKIPDMTSDTLTARFTNATNPKGITHDCEKVSLPGKEGNVSCNGHFTYTYDDKTIYVREIVESIGKVFSGRAPLSLSPAASADTPNTMEGHVIIPVSTVEDAKKGR